MYQEGGSLSRCPPLLTAPPVLPHAQVPLPSSTSVTPKPTRLSQHVQTASLHSREKKSQAATGFIKGNPWLGHRPADPVAEGSGWAASRPGGGWGCSSLCGAKAERRGRPLHPCAREAAFHFRRAGGHAQGRHRNRALSPGLSTV